MKREEGAASSALLRSMNAQLLLDRLYSDGPSSRVELARRVGLSKPTVSAALADLESARLVQLVGSIEGRPGPAANLYDVNARAGLVAGIDIGRQFVRVAIADLRGEILSRRDVRNTASSAVELVRKVDTLIRSAAEEAHLSLPDVASTVLASPGTFDPEKDRFRFADNLPGWGQRGLAASLRETLGVELAVYNDINLAAIAEHTEGVARGCRHFVLISIGTGVGMGIMLNGELYSGASGAAGEVGFLPFDAERPARDGAESPRRRQALGFTESLIPARAVLAESQAAWLEVRSPKEVFDAAWSGDATARTVVHTISRRIGTLITSVSAILDPELVVLTGGIGHNLTLLRPGIEARIKELSPLRPRIEVSALPDTGVLKGALTMAAREARVRLFERRVGRR
jgi:predicted NBD/HSP70 family sugar kinase